jgi:hypothetical protein
MVSPGGTKRDLQGGFDSGNAAEEFARENGYEYCDENGFVWRLEVVDDDPISAGFIIPNAEWRDTFLEFREHGDDQALLYLCDTFENNFNRYFRLKYKAIRSLVDALMPLNRIMELMESDEIPMNNTIETAYRNLMQLLVEVAENPSGIV